MSTSSYYRFEGIQRFETVRRQAQFCQFGMRLAKRPLKLLPFGPIYERLPVPNGIHRGILEVSVAQIVGSVGRAGEFDRFFRPLHDNQRGRWVDMWVMHRLSGWDPITLRQIGNLYFVVDGHHRTSVARASGLIDIIAEVTEYPVPLNFDTSASLASILMVLDGSLMADIVSVL